MISVMTLILQFSCVGNSELEAERDELAAKVTELEASVDRLEAEKKVLDGRLQKVQASSLTERQAAADERRKLQAEMDALTEDQVWKRLRISKGQAMSVDFTTTLGDVTCALWPEKAPMTVLNFVDLAEGNREWKDPRTNEWVQRPLYNGTTFHRVIPEFMIQGGDPMGTGRGGPGYRFKDEKQPGVTFEQPGLLAMANAGPNTNGSQFFITEGTPTHLNGRHTIFGGECEPMKVVQAIARTKAVRNKPVTDVVVNRVRIRRGG